MFFNALAWSPWPAARSLHRTGRCLFRDCSFCKLEPSEEAAQGERVARPFHAPRKWRKVMRKFIIAAALAAATGTVAAPAMAQVGNSQGLVAVQIQNVDILNNFLNDTQIAALNNLGVPITVQAPISVAANVCDTTVALLSAQRKANSPATCTATSGSAALAQVVQRQ